jgi:hypothetical protein
VISKALVVPVQHCGKVKAAHKALESPELLANLPFHVIRRSTRASDLVFDLADPALD